MRRLKEIKIVSKFSIMVKMYSDFFIEVLTQFINLKGFLNDFIKNQATLKDSNNSGFPLKRVMSDEFGCLFSWDLEEKGPKLGFKVSVQLKWITLGKHKIILNQRWKEKKKIKTCQKCEYEEWDEKKKKRNLCFEAWFFLCEFFSSRRRKSWQIKLLLVN